MEEKESIKFVDWINTLTISDAVNIILLLIVSIVVLILVKRTFRNKESV